MLLLVICVAIGRETRDRNCADNSRIKKSSTWETDSASVTARRTKVSTQWTLFTWRITSGSKRQTLRHRCEIITEWLRLEVKKLRSFETVATVWGLTRRNISEDNLQLFSVLIFHDNANPCHGVDQHLRPGGGKCWSAPSAYPQLQQAEKQGPPQECWRGGATFEVTKAILPKCLLWRHGATVHVFCFGLLAYVFFVLMYALAIFMYTNSTAVNVHVLIYLVNCLHLLTSLLLQRATAFYPFTYRVIHELWTSLEDMIFLGFVIKNVGIIMGHIRNGYGCMGAY